MKATLLYVYVLLAALTLGACSENYLDTESNNAEKRLILSNTNNIDMAVNGLSKMMSTQYLKTQGMSGEGTILLSVVLLLQDFGQCQCHHQQC